MAAMMIPKTLRELEDEKWVKPSFIRDEDERPKVGYNEFSDEIPVISLAGVDADRRPDIRSKIAGACESWGIFQVVDHGVDANLVSEMTRLGRQFFNFPPQEKLRFDRAGSNKGGFFVSNYLQGDAVQDWREIVSYLSYPVKSRDYSKWPNKPKEWRKVTEEYSEIMMGLACKLLGLLSEAIGLETEALTKACGDMEQRVVVNYYPKCPQPDLTLGLKRHTDPGTITVVFQDQVGGLQATRDGGKTWLTVKPIPGAFVVNLGDHVHYMSNGRFKSADHQAVVNGNSGRLSIATFQMPGPEEIVYPLAIREGGKPIYEKPITFSEMFRQKMSKDLEYAQLKKLAKEQHQQAKE